MDREGGGLWIVLCVLCVLCVFECLAMDTASVEISKQEYLLVLKGLPSLPTTTLLYPLILGVRRLFHVVGRRGDSKPPPMADLPCHQGTSRWIVLAKRRWRERRTRTSPQKATITFRWRFVAVVDSGGWVGGWKGDILPSYMCLKVEEGPKCKIIISERKKKRKTPGEKASISRMVKLVSI